MRTVMNLPELIAQAEMHTSRGDLEQALQIYIEILKSHPNNGKSLEKMGTICLDIKRYPLARNLFSRLRQIHPQHIFAFYGEAFAAFQLGDLLGATKVLEEALGKDPDNSRCLFLLCEIFVQKKQF